MAKRILLVFLVFSASFGIAQVTFWTETFGAGCSTGTSANGLNAGNGPWAIVNAGGVNQAFANTWYVSAEENGNAVGTCGSGCGANRTLHVGNVVGSPLSIFCPAGDCGAAYDAGLGAAQVSTDKRAESPTINCTGQSTISLAIDYLTFGAPGLDYCEIEYFNGAVWAPLVIPAQTTCGNTAAACAVIACGSVLTSQGIWGTMTVPLPVSANNNPLVKVGFRWRNNDDAAGGDPSFAVDNIRLMAPAAITTFTPSFILTPSVCVNGVTNVTANTGTTVATGYTWSASPAGPVIGTPNNVSSSITYPAAGLYSITLTVASGTVIGTITNTILVVPNPVVGVSASPNPVCLGNSSTLTAVGATNYNWTGGSLSSSTGAIVVATPGSTSNYVVTGTTAGCSGTAAVTVTVNPAPLIGISASPSATICPGGTSTLVGTGGLSYTWSPSIGLSSTFGGTVVAASPPSSQLYVLTGIDAAGCTGTTSINVSLGPPLTITVSPAGTSTTCVGGTPVTFTALGAVNYVWSPASGLSVAFGPLVTASPTITTVYTVLGSTGTCTGIATVTVSVLAAPIITVVPTSTVLCFGTSTNFTASGASTYTWAPPNTLSSNTGATVTASPTLNPVSYTVVGQSAAGCLTNTVVVTLTVVPIPTQTIGLQTNTLGVAGNTICSTTPASTSFTLSVGSPIPPPGLSFQYSWTPSPSTIAIILGPNVTATPTILVQPYVPAVQSIITYSLQTFYAGMPGCKSGFDTVSIRILNCNPPAASFTTASINDTICTRGCITFMNTTTGGNPQTLLWNFPGGKTGSPATSTSTVSFPVVCYNVPGTYSVNLTVTNPYGNSYVQSQVLNNTYIHVVDTPNTKGLTDTCIRFGKTLQLRGTLATYYKWSPGSSLSCVNCANPIASPSVTTQYIVTGYNSKKCKYNDTVDVCVINDCGEMFVPNAFSPNKDLINDVLYVRGKCLKNMVFQVFNRWGEMVFETHDQAKGWDGTYNGDLMNTAVFVFRLQGTTWDDEPYSLKGNITLIR